MPRRKLDVALAVAFFAPIDLTPELTEAGLRGFCLVATAATTVGLLLSYRQVPKEKPTMVY